MRNRKKIVTIIFAIVGIMLNVVVVAAEDSSASNQTRSNALQICIGLGIIILAFIIYVVRIRLAIVNSKYKNELFMLELKNNQQQRRYKQEMASLYKRYELLNAQIKYLNEYLKKITRGKETVSADLSALSEKYERALRLYPNLEQEIAEGIRQEIVQQNARVVAYFDANYASFLSEEFVQARLDEGMNGWYIAENVLNSAIDVFNNVLSPEQRKQSHFDIDCAIIKRDVFTYRIAVEKASDFNKMLESNLAELSGNDEESLTKLEALFEEFSDYAPLTKRFINQELIALLKQKKHQGSEEKRKRIAREKATRNDLEAIGKRCQKEEAIRSQEEEARREEAAEKDFINRTYYPDGNRWNIFG